MSSDKSIPLLDLGAGSARQDAKHADPNLSRTQTEYDAHEFEVERARASLISDHGHPLDRSSSRSGSSYDQYRERTDTSMPRVECFETCLAWQGLWKRKQKESRRWRYFAAFLSYFTLLFKLALVAFLYLEIRRFKSDIDSIDGRISNLEQDVDMARQAADSAQHAASDATTTARTANNTAWQAQHSADSANKVATTASDTASQAQLSAMTAQDAAKTANEAAQTAQNSASSASSLAVNANNTAWQAQHAADSANKVATTANDTASHAQLSAIKAQDAADKAKDTAHIAEESASNATVAAYNASVVAYGAKQQATDAKQQFTTLSSDLQKTQTNLSSLNKPVAEASHLVGALRTFLFDDVLYVFDESKDPRFSGRDGITKALAFIMSAVLFRPVSIVIPPGKHYPNCSIVVQDFPYVGFVTVLGSNDTNNPSELIFNSDCAFCGPQIPDLGFPAINVKATAGRITFKYVVITNNDFKGAYEGNPLAFLVIEGALLQITAGRLQKWPVEVIAASTGFVNIAGTVHQPPPGANSKTQIQARSRSAIIVTSWPGPDKQYDAVCDGGTCSLECPGGYAELQQKYTGTWVTPYSC